ncbi:uroporphyrinogen decarboxylase family protein [Accumulibacter sp.]|uniref:uroporphyrinogen decarboxylase family protein n=1 Tax=Accumulibacter sp. TaxID=2053492 RepID=UPI0025F5BDEE|nr:uroporphyrinogen decarboxylase family protein [Accumulibacter sp.]MCM8596969.1 uroporphyrinogen decarboxylase family protein [Accumulibacter sp.]MCM8624463.1 uroporphyrinogen decarboxylase family protein [Accumulibacter sp.]MDS4051118.1 uroporphyrinogen decarboxylase family protein [Accumulibacter sp.]
MNSMQRCLAALAHQEPDRVPLFLLATLHGARELGMPIAEYFSAAEHVVEGQLRLFRKYRGDCLYAFFYAAIEAEAWGGSTHFRADGPPACGEPVIGSASLIDRLDPPAIDDAPGLLRVIETIRRLSDFAGDRVPVIGVAISPFSLPVMQMGFAAYLDLIHDDRARFEQLMRVNEEFTVSWANAQLAAGATAICYFDPLSAASVIPPALYRQTGRRVARRTLARITGPTATHLASGRALPIMGDLADTGTLAVGVSALEDLRVLKAAAGDRVALLGNLNGVEMRRWTPVRAEAEVRRAIAGAARGGGFILSDNHGEIPWQVADQVLMAIGDAVERWGRYPLDWIPSAARAG